MREENTDIYINYLKQFMNDSSQNMFGYFYSAKIESHHAEDLVSEVFITALMKIKNNTLKLNCDSYIDFSRYLWGIARVNRKAYFRKQGEDKTISIHQNENIELTAKEETDLEDSTELLQFSSHLKKAISKLPKQQGSVAALALLPNKNGELLNRTEISNILGMSPTTVTKNLQRAKAKLRIELKQYSEIFKEKQNAR